MTRSRRRATRRYTIPCACFLGGSLAGAVTAQTPTLSLKAVRINPFCIGGADAGKLCSQDPDCASLNCGGEITPTNHVVAVPGEVLECHAFASNWSPNGERLTSFQVTIDQAGLSSGSAGRVGPLDTPRPCQVTSDCADLVVDCDATGFCQMPPEFPDSVTLDTSRPDYIYAGVPHVPVPDVSSFRVGAFLVNTGGAPQYSPPRKYAGTFRFVVSPDAAGTFTIEMRPPLESGFTGLNNASIEPLIRESLVVVVETAPPVIVASSPPHCHIEPRQPAEPDGLDRVGPAYMDFDLGPRVSIFNFDVFDFSVRQIPGLLPSIGISGLTFDLKGQGHRWLRVEFDRPISPGRWTCVTVLRTEEEFCQGHLPGDVDADGMARAVDLFTMLECVESGGLTCDRSRCDVDRSRACTPKDLLRLVDLLNGAAFYTRWNGQSLSPCAPGR